MIFRFKIKDLDRNGIIPVKESIFVNEIKVL